MKRLVLTQALYDYVLDTSLRESSILKELRTATAELPLANMQIAPEQGQFMQLLLQIMQAKKVLELGTFTGYSALAMAMALPAEGEVITCDLNPAWSAMAQHYWEKSGQAHKIKQRLGPALETLHVLLNDGGGQQFDFIFIDADKTNYLRYYELALLLIKPMGLIAIDNVLWDGTVIEKTANDPQTRSICQLNEFIQQDTRVDISLLTVADGLFLIRPKNSSSQSKDSTP